MYIWTRYGLCETRYGLWFIVQRNVDKAAWKMYGNAFYIEGLYSIYVNVYMVYEGEKERERERIRVEYMKRSKYKEKKMESEGGSKCKVNNRVSGWKGGKYCVKENERLENVSLSFFILFFFFCVCVREQYTVL